MNPWKDLDSHLLEQLIDLATLWETEPRRRSGFTVREFFAEQTVVAREPQLLQALEEILDDCDAFAVFDREHRPVPAVPGCAIVREIGRGGMGIVLEAWEVEPGRRVAVKMLPDAAFRTSVERRSLLNEARLVGQLQHPHVVTMFRCGETEATPFLVMEYLAGGNLAQLWSVTRPTPKVAARRLVELAEAIAFAHERGVIHRDLKPSNVLVGHNGLLKISDFGIAKDLHAVDATCSRTGPIGTYAYTAPEQARGASELRSDVYGLGAILYFALTGRPPFDGSADAEILNRVEHDAPLRPRTLVPGTPRDLETICLKCLEKSPDRRYATAAELAADLRRFLDDRPIVARPISRLERAQRWCRREPWRALAVTLSGLTALLLLVFTAFYQQAAAREQTRRHEIETAKALEIQSARLASQARHERARELLNLGLADAASIELRQVFSTHASWDTRRLLWESQGLPFVTRRLPASYWRILASEPSHDSRQIATSDAGGQLYIWDAQTGDVVRWLRIGRRVEPADGHARWLHLYERGFRDFVGSPQSQAFTDLKWAPAQRGLVAAGVDGTGRLFDLADGKDRVLLSTDQPLVAAALDPDQAGVLFGDDQGNLFLVGLDGQRRRHVAGTGDSVVSIRFLAALRQWVVGNRSGTVRLLDADELTTSRQFPVPGPLWRVEARDVPDGAVVAVAGGGASAYLVRIPRAPQAAMAIGAISLGERRDDIRAIHDVGLSSDATQLRALDSQGALWNVDLKSQRVRWRQNAVIAGDIRDDLIVGEIRKTSPGFELPFWYERISGGLVDGPHPGEFITAGRGAVTTCWATPGGIDQVQNQDARVLPPTSARPRLVFDRHEPNQLWALCADGLLVLYDVASARLLDRIQAHHPTRPVVDLATATNPACVLTAGSDRSIRCWQARDGRIVELPAHTLRYDADVMSVAVSPKDRLVATVDAQARLWVREFGSGEQVFLCRLNDQPDKPPLTGRVAFNRDGTRLAAFGAGQTAALFQTHPFRRLSEQLWVAGSGGMALNWSPYDADLVFVADDARRLAARYLSRTRIPPAVFQKSLANPAASQAIRSTADGQRIVVLYKGGTARFVDAQLLLPFVNRFDTEGLDHDLAFSPDDRWMAVSGMDGLIKVWDTTSPSANDAEPIRDETAHWDTSELLVSDSESLQTSSDGVSLDAHGVLRALVVRSGEADSGGEGAVEYVELSDSRMIRERLELGDEFDRRISPAALTLVLPREGAIEALFRRRTAGESPYDGELWLARRQGAAKWRYERIFAAENHGFSPVLLRDANGQPREILHFSHDDLGLMRSVPRPGRVTGWADPRPLGDRGWGFCLDARQDRNGIAHLVFSSHRFPGDCGGRFYARWDGTRLEMDRRSIPGEPEAIRLTSDGQPVVLTSQVKRNGTYDLQFHFPGRIPTVEPMQVKGVNVARDFAVAPDGAILFTEWRASSGQLLLWEVTRHRHTVSRIATLSPDEFFQSRILGPDNSGRPAIVLIKTDPYSGSIRLLRPRRS